MLRNPSKIYFRSPCSNLSEIHTFIWDLSTFRSHTFIWDLNHYIYLSEIWIIFLSQTYLVMVAHAILERMDSEMKRLYPGHKQPWVLFSRLGLSFIGLIFPPFIKNKTHECPNLTCDVLSTTVYTAFLSWETTPLFKEGLLSDQGCFHFTMVSDSFLLCSV